jgi:serine/threonine protein kinase
VSVPQEGRSAHHENGDLSVQPTSATGFRSSNPRGLIGGALGAPRSESPTGLASFPRPQVGLEAVQVRAVISPAVQEQKILLVPSPATPPSPSRQYHSPRHTESTASFRSQHSDSVQHVSRINMAAFRAAKTRFHWPNTLSSHVDVPPVQPYPLRVFETIATTKDAVVHACGTDKSQHGFDDTVAVKCVRIKPAKRGSSRKPDKGKEEVKNLQGLSHLHIIAFLGSFVYTNQFCIVMFPAAKYNLEKYMNRIVDLLLQKDPGALESAVGMLHKLRGFFSCLCGAVEYLHNLEWKIKHRDIKPQNILVDQYGTVILTDFGISKRYTPTEDVVTSGKDKAFTVMYAAPEALRGSNLGLDIDIFSLGCVFLEMATVLSGMQLGELYRSIGDEPGADDNIWVVYCKAIEKIWYWTLHLNSRSMTLRYLAETPLGVEDPNEHRRLWLNPEQLSGIGRMIAAPPGNRGSLAELRALFHRSEDLCTCQEVCHDIDS